MPALAPFNRRAQLRRNRTTDVGYTLVEVMMTIAIASVLASVANGAYGKYINSARNAAAINDIGNIKLAIDAYRLNNDYVVPADLSVIGKAQMKDPWGHPYQYLSFATIKGNGNGKKRKDRNLVPINSDFDLYSMGADGRSVGPLTAKDSRDDIVMANDGKYIGLASKY